LSRRDDDLSDLAHLDANRRAWDRLARRRVPLCQPAGDDQFADPLGQIDAIGWLGPSIKDQKVLCLAAGGGRHGPLYSAAGARVTVVDLSAEMLDLDRRVSAERGLPLRIIQASMERMPMLDAEEFDLVVQPVSTCYVPDIMPVFREVSRVLRPGGLYISQHKQPVSLQATLSPDASGRYGLQHAYYRSAAIPPADQATASSRRLREEGASEFLHRWEQIVGGICRCGMMIEDLIEPVHARDDAAAGTFGDRARYIPPYVRIKARRRGGRASGIWLPG
jgi:ubiquinone/menaquinone biosynthesis C-methylase UbiE